MATEGEVPFLEKVYYEGCPGCDFDRQKDSDPRAPYKLFAFVWIITLSTGLPNTSLFPYLYFMIRDLHIAKREEDIGYYAGYVGASFMLGRALTSVFWGIVADRIGRKPVIVISIVAVIIFNTFFGFSTSFWMAISTRFLLGSLNGLLGPMKAYCSEICRPEHQALGLSLASTAWSTALILGPALGGYFAQPAEKYPHIFSENSLFGRFPYLLPCICISIFSCFVLVASPWLPETLHKHKRGATLGSYEAVRTDLKDDHNELEQVDPAPRQSLFKNWPLMSSIIVYCVFSLHNMAYTEIFSLWAVSDKMYGGLSFSTDDVGNVLSITGFCLLGFQLLIYPRIDRALGSVNSLRVSAVLCVPLLSSYAFFPKLSGFALSLVVTIASVLKNLLSVTIMIGLFILQNNAVEQSQRGAANGLSMTAMSFFKTLAPAGAGALFSVAQKRQHASFLPGDQLVFFVLNVIELLGLALSFKPFLSVPGSNTTQMTGKQQHKCRT